MHDAPSTIRKVFVQTRQGRLHCRLAGTGGTKLLLLQILPFGGLLFDAVLPLLAQAGFFCVAPDLMGYGRSDKRSGIWIVEDFADNVADCLQALDVRPDIILGGHFAAMVATALASRTTPALQGLVLDGAPVWPAEMRADLAQRPSMAPIVVREDGGHMVEYWDRAMGMLRKLNPALVINATTAPAISAAVIALMEASTGPGILEAMAGFDMAQAAASIRVPTLVIGGAQDSQSAYYPFLLQTIQSARGHFFNGVHPLHDIARPERADEYAAVLTAFAHGLKHKVAA